MRVKIGDAWHDSNDQPLAVQFTENELACVNQMSPGDGSSYSFCSGRIAAPEGNEADLMLAWLRDGRDVPRQVCDYEASAQAQARFAARTDSGVHCTAHVDYAPETKIPAPELVDCGECPHSSGCVKTCVKWNGVV